MVKLKSTGASSDSLLYKYFEIWLDHQCSVIKYPDQYPIYLNTDETIFKTAMYPKNKTKANINKSEKIKSWMNFI